jgi:hypothetical protein
VTQLMSRVSEGEKFRPDSSLETENKEERVRQMEHPDPIRVATLKNLPRLRASS